MGIEHTLNEAWGQQPGPAEDANVRAYVASANREPADFVEEQERLTAEQRRRMDLARWGRAVGLACTLWAPTTDRVQFEDRAGITGAAEWLYGLLAVLPEDRPTPMPAPDPLTEIERDYRCPECRAGKHTNCPGESINQAGDLTDCPCACQTVHGPANPAEPIPGWPAT